MQHTRTKTITVTETYVTCDRCGREMHPNNQDCAHQERLAVRFRAGSGSVFGDGSLIEADICQHCVRHVLGEWLRVTPDDPFEHKHPSTGRGDPKGATSNTSWMKPSRPRPFGRTYGSFSTRRQSPDSD